MHSFFNTTSAAALAIFALLGLLAHKMFFPAVKQTRTGSRNGRSQIIRDKIILRAPVPTPYHIFFLPGNPGLVEYYAGFLESLHKELNDERRRAKFHVVGRSFAGFEIESEQSSNPPGRLYSLAETVDVALDDLRKYVDRFLAEAEKTQESQTAEPPKIILAGHSFGTFALTEVVKRLQLEQSTENFQIIGGILLFPPISDIASSARGSIIAVRVLSFFIP